ncbi:MAG TPA: DUF547 domain-containing protein [Saprospiraceae bacterium]|nr:DUF547 domain-containing protein [Saprospiraceae bacterium]HMQ84723.1 DUF547 domain-containing protein [Saprospiraceae bacterium]
MAYLLTFLFSLAFGCATNTGKVTIAKDPISHKVWDDLLHKHVNDAGFVNYKGFIQDSTLLNQYLQLLASSHPQDAWSREAQMAYWINAYNAYTVKLIVDHYPVPSIKDIKRGIPFVNTVWDIKFIHIQDQTYDLNNIEHGILRKDFDDARIHAAVNCASYSCPRLRNEAYVAERLEEQLDDAMRSFINDPMRNRVSTYKAELSQIFSWFSGDFKQNADSIREYINRYATEKLSENGKITHIDYDWQLNDAD